MKIEISGKLFDYENNPDHCPSCHHAVEPVKIGSNLVERDRNKGYVIEIIFRCPRRKCQYAFIAGYRQNFNRQYNMPDGEFILRYLAPHSPEEPNIPEEISKISPNYITIFSQSASAEGHQLDQIAGVGYRKALEYLIKDYAIHKNPDDEEKIKSSLLGNCIRNYVDDANVKACAARAAWLGNDETHYVRKWEEKDIKDLKILLKLTEAWISNNLLTEKYMGEMQ